MSEFWDVYDSGRRFTGKTHKRGIPMNGGEYHLVVEIWTVNDREQILLTKRHPLKHFGGLWESTGGSVLAGEGSLAGARRELWEETGIEAEEPNFELMGSIQRHSSFLDSYIIKKPVLLTDLNLQPEEVTDAKWVTVPELERLCEEGEIAEPVGQTFRLYRKKILSFL